MTAPDRAPATDQVAVWRPSARRVTTVLGVGVALLTAANVVVTIARRQGSDLRSHAGVFDVDFERNVPTWFSSVLLLLIAVVMLVIAMSPAERRDRLRWRILGGLALVMSVDEVAVYHELWIGPTRSALGTDGALYFAWVIPALALVAVVGALSLRFLMRLPRATAIGLVLSAACYVIGAVGLEMASAVEGQRDDFSGFESLRYDVVVAVEELLEMLGALGALHTLLRHLERRGGVEIRVGGTVVDG